MVKRPLGSEIGHDDTAARRNDQAQQGSALQHGQSLLDGGLNSLEQIQRGLTPRARTEVPITRCALKVRSKADPD